MTERISRAVLATGCSTGIGRATALRLARAALRRWLGDHGFDAALRTQFPTPRLAQEASR